MPDARVIPLSNGSGAAAARSAARAAALPAPESAPQSAPQTAQQPEAAPRAVPDLDAEQAPHSAGSQPAWSTGPVTGTSTETSTGTGRPDEEASADGTGSGTAERLLGFLRRRLAGDYPVDEFGFDAELTESVLLAPARPLYERYFRVETRGMEHVPDTGAALLVANHSGTIPLDAVMTQLALLDHHPAHRHLRLLGADLVFRLPIVSSVARKGGATLACNADAERLLTAGHLVGVWPEGYKGIGKPFSERYKLQRFGRGGFVSAALRTGAPIIPCSIVGAEEIYPIVGNASWLARLVGLPYVPITPTFPWLGALGLVPLPSKWIIEFGEPIETAGMGGAAAAEDPMLVFNVTDEVRETIQSTLYRLLMQRRSVFF